MVILALDTTTRGGSAAVMHDGEVLAVATGDAARTHAERLPDTLVRVLRDARRAMTDVDLFAVAAGPGSFTGLRIGIATIQGLSFALGRPAVGVSVLDALAEVGRHAAAAGRSPLVAAWMDAQRGEVFAALYPMDPGASAIDGPVSEPPALVLDRWNGLAPDQTVLVAGDGLTRYREVLAERLGDRLRTVEPLPPLAPTIARLAASQAAAGRAVAPHAIRPIYVRRPDAELARDRKQ